MGMEMNVFLTFGGTLILIFLLGKTLVVPIKIILKILLNSIIGAVLLLALNYVGTHFGFIIPVNPLNAVLVGILGVPGVIMLYILCNF